jgi:hypothetical protein
MSGAMLLMVAVLSAGPAVAEKTPASSEWDFGLPVSGETLDSLSGGQSFSIDTIDLVMNNMDLKAEMTGNLLQNATTGINRISDDAFAHAGGISTVVQNSGNQVIINNALILNLQMK